MDDKDFVGWFCSQVAGFPGVRAVTLGGSRGRGTADASSDWDFALYYRGRFDTDALREAGWDGQVFEPGEWGGGVMNGGAWLQIDGRKVDLHYRDLDEVEHWWSEAEEGRFQKQMLLFYLAGVPTYVVLGELAVNSVLIGDLPRPAYPDLLRQEAERRWNTDALLSLTYAEATLAQRGDLVVASGNLARALIEAAHARLAASGEWVINEKGIVRQAGLGRLADLFVSRTTGDRLEGALAEVRQELQT